MHLERKIAVALVLFVLAGAPAASGQSSVTAGTQANRDRETHWPDRFNPAHAPVFTHNELLIHANCRRVWSVLTDAVAWPSWFILTKDVSLDGGATEMQHGTVLHMRIFGSPINSTIDEFVPETRLSWIPQGLDEKEPMHYHTWRLVPQAAGCLAITEETGIGPNDRKAPAEMEHTILLAHDLWLASLRWKAEQ